MMKTTLGPRDLIVSLQGRDSWSGRRPDPDADGTDGPLASVLEARKRVRRLRAAGALHEPMTVWIRGGHYPLLHPLCFGPEDSGPVTYAAWPGETVVLDAGRRIGDFEVTSLNGRTVWKTDVSAILASTGFFRQLFVNGVRRPRARLPKAGAYFWMQSVPANPFETGLFAGSDRFVCQPGDVREFRNLADVEIVAMHFWTEERMPLASVDEQSGMVRCRRRSIFELVDDIGDRPAKYYVDHVFEGLTDPGEWYLDRSTATLYYLPMDGETPSTTEVIAGGGVQFIRVIGKPEENLFVEGLTFRGLTFRHADWVQPDGYGRRYDPFVPFAARRRHEVIRWRMAGRQPVEPAAVPQAACNVPGAIFLEGARHCAIEDCTVEHIGFYAIEFSDGCLNNRVTHCLLRDLGAGGVKISGSGPTGDRRLRTGNTVVSDCHIHGGGRIFLSAIGVLVQHAFGNWIAHNHIHDFYYTGISSGWVWGYAESVARENRIEKNHIHDLGKGVISDMGGVYLLGIQPGTRVAGNVIHDIHSANYGGWGIYPDEGSSHIVIENNIVWNTSSQPFHQHFGRENILRNNIWALGREGQMALSRGNAHDELYAHPGRNISCAFTFIRNIVVTDRQPAFVGALADATGNLQNGDFCADLNLYWDVSGGPIVSGNGVHGKNGIDNLTQAFDWAAWQRLGFDRHSRIADPKFADLSRFDFTLAADSPALGLGFQPIDTSDVGPRAKPDDHGRQLPHRLD